MLILLCFTLFKLLTKLSNDSYSLDKIILMENIKPPSFQGVNSFVDDGFCCCVSAGLRS